MHAALDARFVLHDLRDAAAYARFAGGLVACADVIEDVLADTPAHLFPARLPFSSVTKRAAVDAERRFLADHLGVAAPPATRETVEAFTRAAAPDGRGAVLGVLYVSIGSALGGAVIHRVASRAPWWCADRPALLRPYGRGTGSRWRLLVDALGHLPDDEIRPLVTAARAAFRLHLDVMTPASESTARTTATPSRTKEAVR